MPTYIEKITDSDLTPFVEFNKVISSGTGTDTSIIVALTGSEVVTGGFITESGVPNSEAWEDGGTWTFEYEYIDGTKFVEARARCIRLDSAGTILQTGSYTTAQDLSVLRTFDPVAPAWTDGEEDVNNRLAIEIEFINTKTAPYGVEFGVGTTANEIVTDITENNSWIPVSGGLDLFIDGYTAYDTSGNIVLFTNGLGFLNDNISSFIHSHQNINNNITLITIGHETIDDNITLLINGWDSINNNIDLFVTGHQSENQAIELFVCGCAIISDNIFLTIHGFESLNNSIHLYQQGYQSFFDTIELFIYGVGGITSIDNNTILNTCGHQDSNDNIILFINGLDQINDFITLNLNGHEFIDTNVTSFINGLDLQTNFIELFVGGSATQNDFISLFASGLGFITNNISLYISSITTATNNLILFVNGPNFKSNDINFYINGFTTINDQIDLFIRGHQEINNSIILFTAGAKLITDNILCHIKGLTTYNDNICLLINGYDFITDDITFFVQSHLTINDDIPLFVNGSGIVPNIINYSLELYITTPSFVPIDNSIDLLINGYVPIPETECPTLDPTVATQITSDLVDIYQSRIDALINQLGKHVLLEFDLNKISCPNCIFDPIGQRSTGIYITNPPGPRPFKRNRKCPYCKGRGYEETPNTKCIDALIKWNPKNAKNYGIALTNRKDIVRIKTFITDADDLIRAKTAIIDYDQKNITIARTKMIRFPIPVGLRDSRYCISFWELL